MRQIKLEQQKQKEKKEKKLKKKKKEFRKLTVEEKIEIVRIIEEKEKDKEDLIEIRIVEKMIPRRFHKYLKVVEKKELERMSMRKTWNHIINLREEFIPKKKKDISVVKNRKRRSKLFGTFFYTILCFSNNLIRHIY